MSTSEEDHFDPAALGGLKGIEINPSTLKVDTGEMSLEEVLGFLRGITREQIAKAIPDEVIGKENYINLLDPDYKGYWNPNPSAGGLFPYKPGPKRPQEIILATAKNILTNAGIHEDKEKPQALAIALQARLYENMRKLAEERLILVGTGEDEKAIRLSLKELEAKFNRVKDLTREWDPDSADLRMAIELGLFDEATIKEKLQLRNIEGLRDIDPSAFELESEMITEEIHFGTTLLEEIAEHTRIQMKAQRRYLSEPIQYPVVNPELQDMSLMELLEKLFDKNTNARVRNDIQLKLTFANLGFLSSKRLKSIEKSTERKMREGIKATFEATTQKVVLPEIEYKEGNFSITGHREEIEAKIYRGARFSTTNSSLKSKKSKVIKSLYPDEEGLTQNNLTDEARMRVVALESTSKELSEAPEKQDHLKDLLKTLWRSMGNSNGVTELTEGSNEKQTIRALKRGQAIIVNKLNSKNYPKITLYGQDENGVMTEIQLLPVDTHLLDHARNSPFAHKYLDEEKLSGLCELAIPASLNNDARKALDISNKERKALREPGAKARERFLNVPGNITLLKAVLPNSES